MAAAIFFSAVSAVGLTGTGIRQNGTLEAARQAYEHYDYRKSVEL
jgi:hypothetical protein